MTEYLKMSLKKVEVFFIAHSDMVFLSLVGETTKVQNTMNHDPVQFICFCLIIRICIFSDTFNAYKYITLNLSFLN